MPATLLGNRSGKKFDVIGSYRGHGVGHVGLLAADSRLEFEKEVEIYDMGPPLHVAPGSKDRPHVVGWLELSVDETEGIEEWLEEMRTLVSNCRYIAFPSAEKKADQVTGRTIGWRFSCAGFVRQAYLEGGKIELTHGEGGLPKISLGEIQKIWNYPRPSLARRGLEGDGPWAILLPGYLIHALAQSENGFPFRPNSFHADFP